MGMTQNKHMDKTERLKEESEKQTVCILLNCGGRVRTKKEEAKGRGEKSADPIQFDLRTL